MIDIVLSFIPAYISSKKGILSLSYLFFNILFLAFRLVHTCLKLPALAFILQHFLL